MSQQAELRAHSAYLREAILGSFHRVSIKHLHRNLSEFETRFNARKADDKFVPTLRQMLGVDPIPYAELIEQVQTSL